MKKIILENYLNSLVERNIKISNYITKENLIIGLIEQQSQNANPNAHNPMNVTTMVDMVGSAPKVDFVKTRDMSDKGYKIKPGLGFMNAETAHEDSQAISEGKPRSNQGQSKNKNEGQGANYSQRLGMPAISFTNQEYNQLSDAQLKGLSKLFSPEQIQKIYSDSPSNWNTLDPKQIYVTEKGLKSANKVNSPITIYFDDAGQYYAKMPYGWVNSLYTRSDEGRVRAKVSPHDGSNVVPMQSTAGPNQIKGLHLGDRWAIALTIPGEQGSFLVSLQDDRFNAFFGN